DRGHQAPGDRLARVEPEDLDRPGGGPRDAEHHVDRGRLAGPVGAEEGHDLPGLESEGHTADGVDVAEVLGGPRGLDGGHAAGGGAGRPRDAGLCHGSSLVDATSAYLTQPSRVRRDVCQVARVAARTPRYADVLTLPTACRPWGAGEHRHTVV